MTKHICWRDISRDKREILVLVAISSVMLLVKELLPPACSYTCDKAGVSGHLNYNCH